VVLISREIETGITWRDLCTRDNLERFVYSL